MWASAAEIRAMKGEQFRMKDESVSTRRRAISNERNFGISTTENGC